MNLLDLVLKETSGFKEKLLYFQEIYKEQELPKKKKNWSEISSRRPFWVCLKIFLFFTTEKVNWI